MKIFVTGCAGLLGANYTRHLIQSGHQVIGIDDLSGCLLYTSDAADE